ncbi:MAG TPA: nuclease-related domain-containing protein [Elusimicrobiota bacterium]|nr:nuclease-related domain-containing protein [Elusimicrobiota bacterium]
MATVIGKSGVWREIVEQLGRSGFHVRQPADVDLLLSRLRDNFQPSVKQKKSEITQCVATEERSIATLMNERGIWRSFVNWFRIQGRKIAISHLRREERRYITTLSENIRRLDACQKSREMAGARAELEVIAHLTHLSSGHTVFNNLLLTADRYINFNDVALQSAQIDHLVLSPAGVFVIETKRWSRHFVESGEYHNPFDQIQRAAYLCYDQLRNEFGKIRVRSVIACAGKLPSAPEDSHVKVLPVTELIGYISWFKQPELTPDKLLQVRHYLEGFVTI